MGNTHTTNTAVRANFTFEFGDLDEKEPKKTEPLNEEELEKQYRTYILRVYLLAFIFIVIAFFHWYLVTINDDLRESIRNNKTYLAFCFGYAILIFILFIFNEGLRRVFLLDYVLAFIIVELIIICCCIFAAYTQWTLIVWSGVVVGLLFLVSIGGASVLTLDLTQLLPMIFMSCFILLGGAVLFLMIFILTKIGWTLICFMILMAIVLILFVLFHTQCINGGYVMSFFQEDALLGSLFLFLDFITLFSLIYVLTRTCSDRHEVR